MRTALQNAASVAGLLVTTEAMVAVTRKTTLLQRCRVMAWAASNSSSRRDKEEASDLSKAFLIVITTRHVSLVLGEASGNKPLTIWADDTHQAPA